MAGCTALLSAAVAFPAGIWVSRMFSGDEPSEGVTASRPLGSASTASGKSVGRNPYSPHVMTDPYVIEQQTEVVEAMERSCEQFGENCEEAEQGKRYIEEQAAPN